MDLVWTPRGRACEFSSGDVTVEARGIAVGDLVRLSLTNGLTLFPRLGKWARGF